MLARSGTHHVNPLAEERRMLAAETRFDFAVDGAPRPIFDAASDQRRSSPLALARGPSSDAAQSTHRVVVGTS